jgi:hypothetical protein
MTPREPQRDPAPEPDPTAGDSQRAPRGPKRSAAQTMGGILFGFEQQVLRTTPPPHELVHQARPDAPVPSGDGTMLSITLPDPDGPHELALDMDDLRAIAGYAAACALEVLEPCERARPADSRPRDAIEAALAFARGGRRERTLRDAAWAALRAARDAAEAGDLAAAQAARAAMAAASAAYLHPLADPHQVKHILGAAAHAARAAELAAGEDRAVGDASLAEARRRASPAVIDVLRRYPEAPPGGGRIGELIRALDVALRAGPGAGR